MRRVLDVLVLYVSPQEKREERCKMTRATMNAFTFPSSAAPDKSSATSRVTSSATSRAASFTGSSLTCSSFTCHLRESVAWVPPLTDDDPSSAAPNNKRCIGSAAGR